MDNMLSICVVGWCHLYNYTFKSVHTTLSSNEYRFVFHTEDCLLATTKKNAAETHDIYSHLSYHYILN